MSDVLIRRVARWRVPLGFVIGVAVLALAEPTPPSLVLGAVFACLGEALRVWAAGHLEKSREVTRSGPYRFSRHPLYVGSTIMGIGLAVAAGSIAAAVAVTAYLGVMLTAAIRSEEAFLRQRFGGTYDAYVAGQSSDRDRRFSLARAIRNREHRAVAGLAVAIAVLALRLAG